MALKLSPRVHSFLTCWIRLDFLHATKAGRPVLVRGIVTIVSNSVAFKNNLGLKTLI